MWFLVLLTILNASLGFNASLNVYRISVAGLPINILDVFMFLGLVAGPFWLRRASEWGKHPLFAVAMGLCLASLAGGTVMGAITVAQNGIEPRQLITFTRNFAAIPIGLLIGYSVLSKYRSTLTLSYLGVIAGCITATMILRYFAGRAEDFGVGSSINSLRTVDYIQTYAASAAGLLVGSVLQGARMFPSPLALILAGYCALGTVSGLSRSDWIATAAMFMVVFACVPRDRVALRAMQGILAILTLIVALGVGLQVASRVTGTDFQAKMVTRLRSLLPGDQPGVRYKAWDTRLLGAQRELEEGIKSPLIGRGFGFQDTPGMKEVEAYGTRHNSWTNAFVETGLVGVVTDAVIVIGCIVVGRRMIKARTDRGTVLIGAMGVATAAYYGVLGLMTGSFNNQRGGIHLGITLGLVLRARVMQSAIVQQYSGYVDFDEGAQLPGLPLEEMDAAHDAY